MKQFLAKFLAGALGAACILLHAAEAPSPAVLDIGVSPFLDAGHARLTLTNINRLLLTLPPGMEFTIANAYDGSLVATGVSPRLPFDSLTARAHALAPQLVAWRNWLTNSAASPLAGSGAVNPPLYLRSVVERGGPAHGGHVALLIGDPRYRSLESPSFDFLPNRLPSLQFLLLGEDASPFGCADRRTFLSGLAVHWWYISPGFVPSESYAHASRSWWNNWLQAQSAQLGKYSHDWTTIYGGLFMPLPMPAVPLDLARLAASNSKLEMTVVLPPHVDPTTNTFKPMLVPAPVELKPVQHVVVAMPVEEMTPDKVHPAPPVEVVTPEPPSVAVVPAAPVLVPSPSPVISHGAIVPVVQPVVVIPPDVNPTISSVGIIWHDRKVDLDISLRVKPGALVANPGELCWNTPPLNVAGSKLNSLGRYLHDYRSGGLDYEWIELASTIGASDLAKNYEVWCDNYQGKGPVSITAAVVDHGRIIATRDLIIPGKGDGRRGAGKRDQSPSWLRLPIEDMINTAKLANQ